MSKEERRSIVDQVADTGLLRNTQQGSGAPFDLIGTVSVARQDVQLGLILPAAFPTALPVVKLLPSDALGFLPHVVEPDDPAQPGFVCYQDSEGIVLNRRDPVGLATEALRRAIGVLEDGVSGANRSDFADEWEVHWAMSSDTKLTLIAVGELPSKVSRLSVFDTAGDLLFLASGVEQVTGWVGKRPTRRGYVLFIPLAEATCPLPPSRRSASWTAEEVKTFVFDNAREQDRSSINRIARQIRIGQDRHDMEIIVLSLPRPSGGHTLFAISYKGVRGNTHPLIRTGQQEVRRVRVHRWDKGHIVPRGGASSRFERKQALIIGCGSIGSRVALELARAGVSRLTLVDPDTLSMENVYRHVLGRDHILKPKAERLKLRIESDLPYSSLTAVTTSIEEAIDKRILRLRDFDVVVCALGKPTLELHLNEQLWNLPTSTKTVFTWVEPHGIGGHALLVRPGEQGCFECLYTPPDAHAHITLANRAAFAAPPPEGRSFGKALSGCGSLFTPYGSLDAAQSAQAAVRLAVGALDGKVKGSPLHSWKGDAAAFEQEGFTVTRRHAQSVDQLEAQRFDYKSPSCPVCGTDPKGRR